MVQMWCSLIVQRWCRGGGEEVQEGAEVLQMQRWCSHSAYVGGAGAEEVIQSDYVEAVQRRCAEVVKRWCLQRWCRAEKVVVPRCKGGRGGTEVVVPRCKDGAAVVVQRWWCRAGGAEGWFRLIVQRWCRHGEEVAQRSDCAEVVQRCRGCTD